MFHTMQELGGTSQELKIAPLRDTPYHEQIVVQLEETQCVLHHKKAQNPTLFGRKFVET